MPNFTLKNIPDDLYLRIKESAERNHRSINSEIIVQLRKVIPQTAAERQRAFDNAAELRARFKLNLTMEEIDAAKRDGRK